jgi:opine dehydrogenase
MSEQRPKFCVVGAGHGGTALAAYLSLTGFPVTLYNRSPEKLAPIQVSGGVELLAPTLPHFPHGFARLERATADMGEALTDAEIVMVAVPATGHRFIAEQCAAHLRDGQLVILNPGRTGGALEFQHTLEERGCQADALVAEAQTFIYASRLLNPGQVQVFRVKNNIPVAALPAYRTPEAVSRVRAAFPQFVPGDNVIKTSMDNIGAIFHPAVAVLNAARIESTRGDFEYYLEGITPSVAEFLEAIDAERVAVAEAMGFLAMTAREWLYFAYDAAGRTLYDAIMANPGYAGIKAPRSLNHRYLWEDVPMSLVPIASLGEMLDVPTPSIRAIIHIACILTGTDYWAEGRTVERLGLAGLSLRQIRMLVVGAKVEEEEPVSADAGEGATD